MSFSEQETVQLIVEDGVPWNEEGPSQHVALFKADGSSHGPTVREGVRMAVSGALSSSNNIPDYFVALATGQTSKLVNVVAKVESGTSIDLQMRRNGTNLGTAHTITATKSAPAYTQALSDGDSLDFTLANPVGSPVDLAVTLVIESVLAA
jgi:hypothetical protein